GALDGRKRAPNQTSGCLGLATSRGHRRRNPRRLAEEPRANSLQIHRIRKKENFDGAWWRPGGAYSEYGRESEGCGVKPGCIRKGRNEKADHRKRDHGAANIKGRPDAKATCTVGNTLAAAGLEKADFEKWDSV